MDSKHGSETQGGYWLPKSPGKFFPDFIGELPNGMILLVEYKMGKMANDPEEQSCRRATVGSAWRGRLAICVGCGPRLASVGGQAGVRKIDRHGRDEGHSCPFPAQWVLGPVVHGGSDEADVISLGCPASPARPAAGGGGPGGMSGMSGGTGGGRRYDRAQARP